VIRSLEHGTVDLVDRCSWIGLILRLLPVGLWLHRNVSGGFLKEFRTKLDLCLFKRFVQCLFLSLLLKLGLAMRFLYWFSRVCICPTGIDCIFQTCLSVVIAEK
jgi:hypothetical protein